jgi:3-oxoacyl-[acyl-carrier-protein] synthase II
LIAGKSGVIRADKWTLDLGMRLVAKIPEFSSRLYLGNLKPPLPSRYCQMALVAAALAIKDAGLRLTDLDPTRIGAILSTDFGPNETVERYLTAVLTQGPQAASPLLFARTVANVALGEVALRFGLRGPSSLVIGENPLTYGFDLLRLREADILLCGGVDELREVVLWAYGEQGLLLPPDAGDEGAEPYGEGVGGLVLGEAAAVLILERLDHAQARGAHVFAEVLGYHTLRDRSPDAELWVRDAGDIAEAMTGAMDRVGLERREIGFVMGGASSLRCLGRSELRAVADVWRNHPVRLANVKYLLGETFGAAAPVSAAAAALALSTGLLPLAGRSRWPADRSVEVVAGGPARLDGRAGLCNSVHIGGNDTSVSLGPPPGVMA